MFGHLVNPLEHHNNRDDGETSLLKIATALQIDLEPKDIQRVHRLGKRKYSTSAKPRPIIAQFISYKRETNFCIQNPN